MGPGEREITFEEADRRYAELKRQREAGSLSEEEFATRLRGLMVQDEVEGRWWAKSRQSGEWHYHDGERWVKGTPPGYEPPSEASQPERTDELSSENRSAQEEDRSATTQADRPEEQDPPVRTPPREDPSRTRAEPTDQQQQPQQPLPDEQRRRGYGKWIAIGGLGVVAVVVVVVIIIAAASSTGVAPPPDPGDIFEDDFESSSEVSSNWDTENTDEYDIEYADGSLHMSYDAPEGGVAVLKGYDVGETLDVDDVIVEVDATKIGGNTDGYTNWGLLCRAQDYDNYYMAHLDTDGDVRIFKQKDDEWDELDVAHAGDAFDGATATHHLRFDCEGNELTMYVNGQEVVQVNDSDFASGNVGMWAENGADSTPGVEVSFDNFLVSSP